MDNYYRLRQFEILSNLSDDQIEILSECAAQARYPKGTQILKEGDQSQDIYLVDKGLIEICRNTPYGSFTLAELGTGEIFGETSFIDRAARSGDARSVEDSVLFSINHRALETAMEQDQRFKLAISWIFWRSLSAKLRSTNNNLAQFFSKGQPASDHQILAADEASSIHVGVGTKRDLFREQKLSPMEINFLATLSKEQKFGPDEYLFREGEAGQHLYVVLEGRVMISKEIIGAGEEALAFMERGDYFGEMALIDQKPRSADAKAHDEGAVVLSISREVMEGILDIQKVSSLKLLTLLCNLVAKRLREIDTKLVTWYIFNAGSGETLGLPDF